MRDINQHRLDALDALTRAGLTFGAPAKEQPKARSKLKHWHWHVDVDGTAWAILDKAGESTNTLSEAVITELNTLLDEVAAANPNGLVLRSAKKNGFVAGAEISEFKDMVVEADIREKIGKGLEVLDKLEDLPFPTVALIHGFCLGGGLELALACKYRICREDSKLGFPEVMLGLHPGLAGTWRSLRVMPPLEAMTAMLTGKNIIGKRAKRLGLVDAAVPERHFGEAVRWAIAGTLKKQAPAQDLKSKAMTFGPVRSMIAGQMEKKTAAKARRDHYPAPYAMIDLWREHGDDLKAMRSAETRSFARLMTSPTSRNLVRAFFLREKLKGYAKGADHGIGHVHVIGAGVMGGDIAAVCAKEGFKVTLQDREIKYIAPAIKRAAEYYKKRIYSDGERMAAMDRLMPDVAGDGLAKADLVIEVVPENPDIKKAVYADCEKRMKRTAILATNTSSILLEVLRDGLKAPKRFCGIHFFNPVAMMPLVEVVTHDMLDNRVQARVTAFVDAIGKLPLPVRSAPGFLVNRALIPYSIEAFLMHSEGIRAEEIDRMAEDFGMPMGPMEMADVVGLDVGMHVAEVLRRDLDPGMPESPDWLKRMVEAGNLGKKTGKGIYRWEGGKPQKADIDTPPNAALTDRLMLPLLNTLADCMADGIVEDTDAADAGMIFATGFAPFRGGPLNYAEHRGVDDVIKALDSLAAQHGERFKPSKGWALIKS
jgi:3-hydroxyacyl-CoA dehydrogenase/enoyl-CoA hydratase/3-hydroxybutyryl-CoA epimerase